MILIDFSAIAYQSMYSAIAVTKPEVQDDGKYRTADFSPFMIFRTLESIFETQQRFSNCGDVVLCLDGDSGLNWRKAVYPMYKSSRPVQRQASPVNFSEIFNTINDLIETLDQAAPYKVVKSPEAEGDDVIMVLAKDLPGPTMIVSADKDLIQMQRYPGIQQYSPMTQKFVTYETKHEHSMDDWLLEHVVLGDSTDDVPRVVDGLEFTEAFKKHLDSINKQVDEITVRNGDWRQWGFTECRPNGAPDIFQRPRFGISTAKREIKRFGGLDAWLDSDPRLRQNYELNKTLVLEEGIPQQVRDSIKEHYAAAPNKTDLKQFEAYLDRNGIQRMSLTLPPNFNKTFTVEDLF